jgi:hypothetical protein
MASPGDNRGTLTAFLHRYYDIQRDAEYGAVDLMGHDVTEETRALFRSDLPEFNGDLIDAEIKAIKAERLKIENAMEVTV